MRSVNILQQLLVNNLCSGVTNDSNKESLCTLVVGNILILQIMTVVMMMVMLILYIYMIHECNSHFQMMQFI